VDLHFLSFWPMIIHNQLPLIHTHFLMICFGGLV